MKKKILLAALVVAAMTSCSKDETTELAPSLNTKKEMSFGVVKGNSALTRTTEYLGDNQELGVFAYNAGGIYENIDNMVLKHDDATTSPITPSGSPPSGSPSTGQWRLHSGTTFVTYYYPADDTDVNFWAYGPKDHAKLDGAATCDAVQGPKFKLKLTENDKDVDIYATQAVQSGKKSGTNNIEFALQRVLAQVQFKAYTDNATTFKSVISSITVKAKGEGEYENLIWKAITGADITWKALDAAAAPVEITKAGTSVNDADPITGAVPLNLIPKDQAAVINIKAKIFNRASGQVAVNIDKDFELDGTGALPFWAQGNAYVYAIKIDTGNARAILFAQPTKGSWVTPANVGLTVN